MNKSESLFWSLIAPLTCVLIISTGQLLFKIASGHLDFRRPLAEPRGLAILAVALALYGLATLLWVAALRFAPLGRLYPIMALSFLLVPLGGMVFLKEPVSLPYWGGAALIIAGLVLISRTSAV
ncbi:MAG: EamA family transporter [Phenylobacterium sp.]